MQQSIGIIFTVVFLIQINQTYQDCWKTSYGRGVGSVPSGCLPGYEKNGALCYPNCKQGFYGVGPVCWQDCPPNFTDTGVDCLKPSAYGRGTGHWTQSACDDTTSGGCERWGLFYYPKCRAGFYAFGCCVCSPDCQYGMTDIGVSCQKQTYTRGAGDLMSCDAGLDKDAGLCYKKCTDKYDGVGPVCWGQCPQGSVNCGAMCADTQEKCNAAMKSQVVDTFAAAVAIAAAVATGGTTVAIDVPAILSTLGKVAKDFTWAVCPALTLRDLLTKN